MNVPMGAWGSGNVIADVTKQPPKVLTPEEIQKADAERKANEKLQVLNYAAQQLANKVEKCFSGRGGGKSGNYGLDEQYEIKGQYSEGVISLAFEKWKSKYSANDVLQLQIHKLGPSKKYSGNRQGKLQVNFIRKIVASSGGRFNIHINVGG